MSDTRTVIADPAPAPSRPGRGALAAFVVEAGRIDRRRTGVMAAALSLLLLLAAYLSFVQPGRSFVTQWLSDVEGLADIANRFRLGQVPYRDFHMPYGPLIGLLPGFGLRLGFDPGAIFGFAGVVTAAVLLLAAVITLPRRLPAPAVLLVLTFAFLLVVVPMTDTQGAHNITWATFYNRQGWAAVIILALFYLEPLKIAPGDAVTDAVAEAGLCLFTLYSKPTFGLVAIGFLIANALTSPYNRKTALMALGGVAATMAGLEAVFHFHAGYLRDFAFVTAWNDALLPNHNPLAIGAYVEVIHRAFGYLVLCALLLFLGGWRPGAVHRLDPLYALGGAIGSFALRLTTGASQPEAWGSLGLFSVFLVVSERARRAIGPTEPEAAPVDTLARHDLWLAGLAAAALFITIESVNRLEVWERVVVMTHGDAGRTAPADWGNRGTGQEGERPPGFSGIRVDVKDDWDDNPDGKPVDPTNVHLHTRAYFDTLLDGERLLAAMSSRDRSVLTFDLVNPFPLATGMKPPIGAHPLFWAFFMRPDALPPPAAFLAGVDEVMVPLHPYLQLQLDVLEATYGAALRADFTVVGRSADWTLWRRKPAGT